MRHGSLFEVYRGHVAFGSALANELLRLQAAVVSFQAECVRAMCQEVHASHDRMINGLDRISNPFLRLREAPRPPNGPSFTDQYGRRRGDIDPERV
jgi:hypothetical protein